MRKTKDQRLVTALGNTIRHQRKSMLLSYKELARIAGVSIGTIRKAERCGQLFPDKLADIARALNLDPQLVNKESNSPGKDFFAIIVIGGDYEKLKQQPQLKPILQAICNASGKPFPIVPITTMRGSLAILVRFTALEIDRICKAHLSGGLDSIGLKTIRFPSRIEALNMTKTDTGRKTLLGHPSRHLEHKTKQNLSRAIELLDSRSHVIIHHIVLNGRDIRDVALELGIDISEARELLIKALHQVQESMKLLGTPWKPTAVSLSRKS